KREGRDGFALEVFPLLGEFTPEFDCACANTAKETNTIRTRTIRTRKALSPGIYPVEDQINHPLVPHRGVDHHVEVVARRPIHPKGLLDEVGAVEVNGFGELDGFTLTLSALPQTAYFFFQGRVY